MLYKKVLLVVLLMIGSQVQAATVIFNEQDFSTWSSSRVAGANNGQTGVDVPSGGNPDGYWQVTTNTGLYTDTISSPAASFTYDFSAGAINEINFSVDYFIDVAFGQGHRFGLFAVQDGNFFSTVGDITSSAENGAVVGQWVDFSEIVTAEDFLLLEGSGILDFSAGASDISFGLRTANTGGRGIIIGYDNFNVELATVSTVPLPAAAWLFGSAILGLGIFRRKSKLAS